MKKILFVVNALGYSGVGKMLVYLANHMCTVGYKVTIYIQEQEGIYYEKDERIEIIQEKEIYKNYYTRRFQQIIKLKKIVAEIEPDVVISFQTNQNALSVLATRGRHIPVIISERGDPYQYTNIIAKLKNIVINKAEGGVFQSQRAKEYFGKKLQKRSCVIFNPSTVEAMSRPAYYERTNEIAFVARFDIHQKRQDLMIHAFAKVVAQRPNVYLGFYGVGNDENKIKNLVNKLNINGYVKFYGLVKNIPEAIKKAKMFVMTSDFEGMPNALIEAMSVGLPCISTDFSPGGAKDLISNGENGYIIPVGNEDALIEKIIYLIDNPEKAEKIGKAAQKVVDSLNPKKIYKEWEEYIKKVLAVTE